MEYRIEKYRSDLKDEVARLQTFLWSPDIELNRAYFEWKYERNPYAEVPNVYLVLSGDKVVGMRGLFGARWQMGSPGNTADVLVADDLLIHPDHRNKGLFSRVMEKAYHDLAATGHEYVFNFSANPTNFVASLATGWRKTAPVMALIRLASGSTLIGRVRERIRKNRFLRERLRRVQILDRYYKAGAFHSREERYPFSMLDRAGEAKCRRINPRISLSTNPRIEEMADLARLSDGDGRIRHVRDAEYFTWRLANPLLRHRFFFWDEGGLQGYLILGQTISPTKDLYRARILDWEATDGEARAGLLNAAILAGESHDLIIWSATLRSDARALLAQNGFGPLQEVNGFNTQRPCILVRAVRSDLLTSEWSIANVRLTDLENWDIRLLHG